MRRLHIPLVLLLALYLVGHYGPRLREAVSNLTEVTQAQGHSTGDHYAPAENLERLDLAAVRSTQRSLDICMYALTVMWTVGFLGESAVSIISFPSFRLDRLSSPVLLRQLCFTRLRSCF
jgi:hypothetical protein